MAFLVSAKGSDVLAWRASGEFAVNFRQQLLARLEFCRSEEAEALLAEAGSDLDALIEANEAFCLRSTALVDEVSTCSEPSRLRDLVFSFYSGLYEHFSTHRSAPAFYELSTRFLLGLSGTIMRQVLSADGVAVRRLPPLELIALGPAGRQEFSPFCPLHLLLVYGETSRDTADCIAGVCQSIHDGFASCGFQVDESVTPRNTEWRGSLTEWRHRLSGQLETGDADNLINFFRIAEQSVLFRQDGFDAGFTDLFRSLLKTDRSAMAFQVTRVRNLSHGIGLMGGMRFEKKGPFRGKFALLDHALQPLSAALTSLALLQKLDSVSAPQRIREVLWKRELNVDMAESLLQAWHTLHELRLIHECGLHPEWTNAAPRYLDIEELNNSEQDALRESLDTVGAIQRHVGLTFSSSEA